MRSQSVKSRINLLIEKKDAHKMAKVFFNFNLTPTQLKIVKEILWGNRRRISVSAMTRYGKSQLIAVAIGLYLIFSKDRKVFFIAPTREKAQILRTYLNDLVLSCPLLLELSDLELQSTEDRLKREVSKSRVTFKNGMEYRVFTAHQDGSGLMGFGLGINGGIMIIDEACEISRKANTKISRMMGDNPENSKTIELYNPWDRDNKAYEHSISEDWLTFRIDWKLALKEKRTTQDFINQQRKELTTLEFEVLYESKFPETSEDAIFKFSLIQKAIDNEFNWKEWTNVERIISCDVADKGLDWTVIFYGIRNLDTEEYVILEFYAEPMSENMAVAGRIIDWFEQKGADSINIDTIGIGTGVVSRVREVIGDRANVQACHFGEGVGTIGKETKPYPSERLMERQSDSPKKRFMNRKAEQYFRLRELMENNQIDIPQSQKLTTELMNMKWEFSSKAKIKILDPEKSPNYADALVYFIWKPKQEVIIDF